MAGTDRLTLADISLVSTYSSVRALGNDVVDCGLYPELEAWFDRAVRQIPNYEAACGEGASQYGAICGPMVKAAGAEFWWGGKMIVKGTEFQSTIDDSEFSEPMLKAASTEEKNGFWWGGEMILTN